MPWSTAPNRRRGQPAAQRQRIMARDHGICHLCHHPQADQIDHIINVAQWTRQQLDGSPHRDSNLAPAHQAPCPTCNKRCHQIKTQIEARAGKPNRTREPEQHPGTLRLPRG